MSSSSCIACASGISTLGIEDTISAQHPSIRENIIIIYEALWDTSIADFAIMKLGLGKWIFEGRTSYEK